MKKLNKLFYLSLVIAFVVGSCTIERRLHNSGYHVTWKKNNHSSEKNDVVQNEETGNEKSVQKTAHLSVNNVIVTSENENEITSTVERSEVITTNPSSISKTEESKSINRTDATHQKQSSHHTLVKSIAKHAIKKAAKNSEKSDDTELILLYILCILIPFVAVGLVTDWDVRQVVINLLLCLLCLIPGVVHAFIVVSDNR